MAHIQAASSAIQTSPLAAAFPAKLRSEVCAVANSIQTSIATHPGFSVVVQGESLNIPYRIHHDGDDTLFSQFTEIQGAIYTCVLTRHHDGYVRQRYVGSLVALSDPWIAPFVAQLCGEYVVEILTQIEASLSSMDSHVYGAFFRDNPVFLERTHDRMISYWDCYYRWLYKRKRDYVGFRVFERFREWEASI